MDCSIDLLTIKIDIDAEEEHISDYNSYAMENVLRDFHPGSAEDAEQLELESEHEFETVIKTEDPLLENHEVVLNKFIEFQVEFNEDDILTTSTTLTSTSNASRKKRAKLELKGRNGQMWCIEKTKKEPVDNETVPAIRQPKGKGPALKLNNPLEAWHLLLDEPILAHILKHTNEKIRTHNGNIRKIPLYKRNTDLTELRAWLGLNYLCGLFRNSKNQGPLEELWTLELGNAIFRATMPFKRFQFLSEYLQFCEETSNKRKSAPIEPVQQIWDKFIVNCRSYYAPSDHCAIEEHILNIIDETCPLQINLPKNPLESGLRLLTLCDAKTLYMCNGAVTTTDIPNEIDILQLICDIKGTQRSITLNERYSSLALATKLQQRQLSLVGALPVTASEIPQELLTSKVPQQLFTASATLHSSLNSYQSPTGFLLSAGISPQIDPVKLHIATYHCGERFQQRSGDYSTSYAAPTSNYRWSLQFFHAILNYAALNAWVLLRLSTGGGENTTLTQRDFLRQLGLYLTQQHLKRRLQRNDKLTVIQKLQICEILCESTDKLLAAASITATKALSTGIIPSEKAQVPEGINLVSKTNEKRQRCRKCPGTNSPKTRLRCQQCTIPLCNRHLITRCTNCTGVQPWPDEQKTRTRQ